MRNPDGTVSGAVYEECIVAGGDTRATQWSKSIPVMELILRSGNSGESHFVLSAQAARSLFHQLALLRPEYADDTLGRAHEERLMRCRDRVNESSNEKDQS